MEHILFICNLLISIVGILYAARTVYMAVGLFQTRTFASAKALHTYAVVIAARNEEIVLKNLLNSIQKQDYPREKVQVFVVADNCTDRTAAVARENGAICYERFDTENATKGYALQFLFQNIEKDFGIESFDGYFIFDADNLLKSDFISRMNDAFDSGERIITSYRNSKNFDDGWLAAGYALHWLRTVRFDNRGRSALGLSSWVQGCGFLVASELLRDGWHYTTFAEDRSFSSDAIAHGIRISYQHEAQFYDEQPTLLRIAWRQRIRWAKGHLQALGESGKALFLGIFRRKTCRERFMCYDMLTLNFPSVMVTGPAKLAKAVVAVALFILNSEFGFSAGMALFVALFEILVFEHLGTIPMAWVVFITERKRIPDMKWYKKLWYSLMFPIFSIMGDIATWIAVFCKVTWKPIPHHADIRIDEIE